MKTHSMAEGEPSIIELQWGLAAVHTDVSFLKDSLNVTATSMEELMQRFQAQMMKQMQEMMKLADKQKRVSDDGEGPSFVNQITEIGFSTL
jgi:uncharacterized protein YaiI (UPF0178 family)